MPARHSAAIWATFGFVLTTSLYAVFYLFNGFPNPVVMVTLGGVTGLQASLARSGIRGSLPAARVTSTMRQRGLHRVERAT